MKGGETQELYQKTSCLTRGYTLRSFYFPPAGIREGVIPPRAPSILLQIFSNINKKSKGWHGIQQNNIDILCCLGVHNSVRYVDYFLVLLLIVWCSMRCSTIPLSLFAPLPFSAVCFGVKRSHAFAIVVTASRRTGTDSLLKSLFLSV